MSALPSSVSAPHLSAFSTDALGSRAARFGAWVVDLFILTAAGSVLGLLVQSADAYAVFVMIAWPIYTVSMMSRSGKHNGQTLGKQLLGLRVVNAAGPPVRLATACKRELLGWYLPTILTLGLYALVDPMWVLWDDRKQALHDKIGGTYVFKAAADPAAAPKLTVPGHPIIGSPSPPPPPPPPPPTS